MKKERDVFKEIIDSAKEVKLTEKERTVLFSAVDTYIRKNPARVEVGGMPGRADSRSLRNDINWFTYIFSGGMRMTSFALAIFLILGGSTSLAAQGALPGDLLYAVKVNINEGVKTLFVSRANRANFEAERAGLRLKEVETLAENGELTEKTKKEAEANFDAHVSSVEKNIEEFNNSGEIKKVYDVSVKFETSLKSHEASLSNLRNNDGLENDAELEKVVNKVQATLEAASLSRENAEQLIVNADGNNDDVRVVAENKLRDAESLVGDLTTISNLQDNSTPIVGANETQPDSKADLQAMSASVTAKPVVGVESKEKYKKEVGLSKAELVAKSIALKKEGEAKLKQGFYKEAFILFKESYEIAQETGFVNELEDNTKFEKDLNLDINN